MTHCDDGLSASADGGAKKEVCENCQTRRSLPGKSAAVLFTCLPSARTTDAELPTQKKR
jgi:hypothetical protein